ncbi:hypothetical protein ACWD0G_32355 [Streptomyces goshikiensis]
MSKPLSMDDLTVKFHSNHADVYCGETMLWQAREGSLYRVVQRLDWPSSASRPSSPPGGSHF